MHAIYIRSKPKSSWRLASVVASQEIANQEAAQFQKQETQNGNEQAKVAIQFFDTSFWIPEYQNEIKEHKPIFN